MTKMRLLWGKNSYISLENNIGKQVEEEEEEEQEQRRVWEG